MSPFDRFFDDAAIFPPGNVPLDLAVKQHVARADATEGGLVGPLVCDVARLPELVAMRVPLRVSLVAAPDEVPAALDLLADSMVELVGIELRGPVERLPETSATVAVEMPWGEGFAVPTGAVLKLRCGGADVPTARELGAAIADCVEHDRPFKLTAGLHAAIAHDGAHGFVNVMAAVVAASRGTDPVALLDAGPDALDLETLGESRRLFRSIGTCSIDEPLAGLRALGLVA